MVSKRPEPRLLLAALASLALVPLGLVPLAVASGAHAAAAEPFARELADPRIAPAVAALKTLLPADYATLIARLTEARRARANPAAVVSESEAYFTELLTLHKTELAAAPASALMEAARGETAFARALRDQAVEVCLAHALDQDVSQKLSEATQKVAVQAYVAKLKAIRAGIDMPTSRPAFSDPDLIPWFKMTVEMYGRERTQLATDPEWLKTATPADQCETSVEPLNAMVALPDESAARVFLKLMDGPATGFAGMRKAPAAKP
jgi:hypothetical protein